MNLTPKKTQIVVHKQKLETLLGSSTREALRNIKNIELHNGGSLDMVFENDKVIFVKTIEETPTEMLGRLGAVATQIN